MPLVDINNAKVITQTYQPLVLAEFTFNDGGILRVATHPLNAAEGGAPYAGNDYFARISEKDIASVQAISEAGVDIIPQVTIHLMDADKFVWTNYELASGKGFCGARLKLTFVMWEVGTTTFSTDSIPGIFSGICDPPEDISDEFLVVTAKFLSTHRLSLPDLPIQKRCPWHFPRTSAERVLAGQAGNLFSGCGYGPDRGVNPLGNGLFTDCNRSDGNCKERGMYKQDSAARRTGSFAGITWSPPSGRTRDYVSGEWMEIKGNPNEAKYGDYFPLVYGRAWVEPPLMNIPGDGNSTRGEAVLCVGRVDITQTLRVIVNGQEVPAAQYFNGSNLVSAPGVDALFRWYWINDGNQRGTPNTDVPWNGEGDPYGSLTAIAWVVHRRVADTASPSVRVLLNGAQLRVYSNPTTFAETWTDNPIWAIANIVAKGIGWDELDIQSFIDAAPYADQLVTYTNQSGASASHKRFQTSMVLRQRRTMAEILRAVRQSCNLLLVPNGPGGKIRAFLKRTLAEQQPSAVNGSNYNTAVSSVLANGTPANGFVAYDFNESNIIRTGDGDRARSSLRFYYRPIQDSPNRTGVMFQDSENQYASSSLEMVDTDHAARVHQEVPQTLNVEAIASTDQAKRILGALRGETLRGNPLNDSRGTLHAEFTTTMQGVRLHVGQIVRFSYAKYGLTNELFRVLKIKPTKNYETITLTLVFHRDAWYTNTYGQEPDPGYGDRRRNRLLRPSLPWSPFEEQPPVGDPMFLRTEWTYKLQQAYEDLADGGSLAKVVITGRTTVNDFAALKAPLIQLQAGTAGTGGTIAGGGWEYFLQVCAKDADGKLGPPSETAVVVITNVGSTNTIVLTIPAWDSTGTGWAVFGGTRPQQLTLQSEGSGTPATITLTSFSEATYGVPDIEFDRYLVKIRQVAHSGVFGAELSGVAASTLTIAGAGWTVDEWVGYDISVIAKRDLSPIGVLNFRITANTADSLTVTPDPAALGVDPLDVVVMRSKPTIGSDGDGHYVEDPRWQNTLSNNGNGLAVNEESGRILRWISGSGRYQFYRCKSNTQTRIYIEGEWHNAPDSNSRYIIEEAEVKTQPSSTVNNSDPAAETVLTIPVENQVGQVLSVQVLTLDGGENESLEAGSPIREAYIFGRPPSERTITEDYTVVFSDRTIKADATAGPITITLLPTKVMRGFDLTIQRVNGGANAVTVEAHPDDTIQGVPAQTLTQQNATLLITATTS